MKRRFTQAGVSAVMAVAGLFIAATAASAHANIVTGVATCVSAPGSAHYNIVWTVANDYNLSETATVTAATGGLTTVTGQGGTQPPYFDIAKSPTTSDESTGTFTQVLATSAASPASLSVTGDWSDGFSGSTTGYVALPKGCVPAPLPLVITASSPTKVYGSVVPTITPSYSGFTNGDTAASLTTQPTCTTTATASSPVGSYPTSCSGAVDAKYSITYVPGTLTVTPAPLVVTASSATKAYAAAVAAITASYSGLVNGDTAASLTSHPSCTTTATMSSPVGSYPTSCSGAVDANYTISYVPGTLTVTPVPLTITASSPPMTYGGTVPVITASYSGFVNGDTSSKLTTPPSCVTTAKSSSPLGSYPTSCSGAVDANYTISYVPGSITIAQAPPLVITASSATMVAGSTVPAITASDAGFVNGDTAASLSTQPTCSTTATSSSPAGTYPTSCTGAVDSSYASISYVPGTLTVTAAVISVPGEITPGTLTTVTPAVTPAVAATHHQKKRKKAVVAAAPLAKPTAIADATTTHTGEPWAGTQGLEEGIALLGLALIGLGELRRRRHKSRRLHGIS